MSLKVVTFNIWHTLDGKGSLRFGEMQNSLDRTNRLSSALEEIKQRTPDLLFIQELNPVKPHSKEISKTLRMDHIFQVDNGGLKLGHLGVPTNLMSGLGIFARKNLQLRKLSVRRLSGHSFGTCSPLFCFQLSEFRYALAGVIQPDKDPILVINTHLHHHMGKPEFEERIRALKKLDDTRKNELVEQIQRSRLRREQEVAKLLEATEHWQRKTGCERIIIAGDFNAEPSDEELQRFRHHDFKELGDHTESAHFPTWNPEANPYAKEDHRLKPLFEVFDHEEELIEFTKEVLQSKRRIDHIWVRGFEVESDVQSIPHQKDPALSDHYGVEAYLR